MAGDMKDTVRKLKKGVGDIARSSPAIAAGEAIAKVGEKVIEHTPEPIRRAGRKLRSKVQGLGSSQRGRIRRHQRQRRRNAAARKSSSR